MAAFEWPAFYGYPPYFTLQPVAETRTRQSELWRSLILAFCRHHKLFFLTPDAADDTPLFWNKAIDRRLNAEARAAFLEDMVTAGQALWLDGGRARALVLWRPLAGWADAVAAWARDAGMAGQVVTVDELATEEAAGTELEGLPKELIVEAVKQLEGRGVAKLFTGSSSDDLGIKFF